MIDAFAALSLLGAAARAENPSQLFKDAEQLYTAYVAIKTGQTTVEKLAASNQLRPLIQAIARVAAVANTLAADPTQMKNITLLLASI